MLQIIVSLLTLLLLAVLCLIGWLYLMPESALNSLQRLLRARAGLASTRIQVEGIETPYLYGGVGEPLVILHGFGGEKDGFNKLAAKLKTHYRMIIPDLPGFGECSASPADDYGTDAQLEHVRALVQQLGLKRISLAGNSMGGWIAAAFAAKYPQEVVSLWLISPGGVESAPTSDLGKTFEQTGATLVAGNFDEFKFIAEYVTAKPLSLPRPLVRVLAERAVARQNLRERIYQQFIASPSLETMADRLTMPTLITWGEQDRIVHVEGGRILHRRLPDARLKILPGVGHIPMVENAAQCAADYLAFRADIDQSRADKTPFTVRRRCTQSGS